MMISKVAIFACLILLSNLTSPFPISGEEENPNEDELIMMIEFGRHGARYPIYDVKPNDQISDWIKEKGELTGVGQREHYLIGREIRKQLVNDNELLSEIYDEEEIFVQSSHYSRTTKSAYAQMAGLYLAGTGELLNSTQISTAIPPNHYDYSKFYDELGLEALQKVYQSIPVHQNGGGPDYLFLPQHSCEGIKETRTKKLKKLESENKDLCQKLFDHFKINSEREGDKLKKNATTATRFWDYIECAKFAGVSDLPYPDEALTKELEDSRISYLNKTMEDETTQKLMNHFVFKSLINSLNTTICSDEDDLSHKKFILLLGHDTTFTSILRAFEQEVTPIKFASILLFNLFKSSTGIDSYYITITYNQSPLSLKLGQKQEPKLQFQSQEFFTYLQTKMFKTETEYFEKCHPDGTLPKLEIANSWTVATYILMSIAIVGILFVMWRVLRKRNKSNKLLDSEQALNLNKTENVAPNTNYEEGDDDDDDEEDKDSDD
jgi:hypothetical protein